MAKKHVKRVYEYINKYCKFGVRPHQLAKALDISKVEVMEALRELEAQGKVRIRSANIEWKSGGRSKSGRGGKAR